jgi:serine/threonine-protein kinase
MSEPIESNVTSYDIESEFGQDDLTIIYRGRRKVDNLPVIIKVVAPQFVFDTYFVMRFKDAVTRAIGLDHPNIVKTYEVAEKDDILYVARELVEGESLAKFLASSAPLTVNQTIDLAKQIAGALDYAHGQGVKHGDLSDSYIFLRDERLWLTDFGLTAAMEGTSLVKKGFAVGEPAYLAPERVRGEGTSRAADLYALGILCYKMLTGQLPFHGEAAAVLHAQAYDQPKPPHELNSSVPKAVSEVVLRMLSKGLEVRYTTGADFVRALEVAAEGTSPV